MYALNQPFWTLGRSMGHLHSACDCVYVGRAAITHVFEVCTQIKNSATPEFSAFKLNQKALNYLNR